MFQLCVWVLQNCSFRGPPYSKVKWVSTVPAQVCKVSSTLSANHYLTLHWRQNACPVEPQTRIRPEFHPLIPFWSRFPLPRPCHMHSITWGTSGLRENLGCTGEKILNGVRRPGWASGSTTDQPGSRASHGRRTLRTEGGPRTAALDANAEGKGAAAH